jgi:plastocyanin
MRFIARGLATLATAVALAACSGAATQAPTSAAGTQAPGTQAPPASQAPAQSTATGATCADSTATTTVSTTVASFTWEAVTAKVGDVITWTNADAAPHRVATDDGSCKMGGNIPGNGGKASLVFSKAGTYPFHCSVHPSMKGTITIN